MPDPFLTGVEPLNTGTVDSPVNLPNIPLGASNQSSPSLLFGVGDKRIPDIFGDPFLEQLTKKQDLTGLAAPSNSYNPYETDFFRYKNDYNYPKLGYLENGPNNAAYYMTQTTWQGAKKAARAFGATTWDTFLNNFAQYGRDFDSLTSIKADSLYDSDFNNEIYEHSKELQDKLYIFGPDGNESSLAKWIPLTRGSLQAYGELLGQLGFTAGTLGAAAAENFVIGILTGGYGNVVKAPKTLALVNSTIYDLVKFLRNERQLTSAISKAGKSLMDASFYAKSAKKAVNFYQMYHAAAAEAAFESITGHLEYKDASIQEFKDIHGYGPVGEDLAKIEQQSKEVGTAIFGLNTALLMVTGALQWGNYLKPFKAAKAITDDVADKIIYTAGKAGAKNAFSTVYDYKIFSKGWFGHIGKTSFVGLKGAIPEGLEESFQNIIAVGTKDYIKQKYQTDKDRASILTAAAKGFSDTFGTSQGWNNFIAGALTGVVSGGVRSATEFKKNSANKAEARKWASRLNSFDLATILDPDKANLNIQTDAKSAMMQSAMAGDKNSFLNIKAAAFREFVFSGIKSGKLDARLQQLQAFSNSTSKEFGDFFGIDEAEVSRKGGPSAIVQNLIDTARAVESDYNYVSKNFKNPVNPGKYSFATKEGTEELVNYAAHEEAKTILALSLNKVRESKNRIKSIVDSLSGLGFAEEDALAIMDPNARKDEINILRESISAIGEKTVALMLKRMAEPTFVDKVAKRFEKYVGEIPTLKGSGDYITQLKDKLARLEKLDQASTEKEYKEALRAHITAEVSKSNIELNDLSDIDTAVNQAFDYNKINQDNYVARKMYDYLSAPTNFNKLSLEIQGLFTGLFEEASKPPTPTAAKTEKPPAAPAEVVTKPVEAVAPKPEYEVGETLRTENKYYEVTAFDGTNVTVRNMTSGITSIVKKEYLDKWIADGTVSKVGKVKPEEVDLSESSEAYTNAVKAIQLYNGPLEAFDDYSAKALSNKDLTKIELEELLEIVENKKTELSKNQPKPNPNKSFIVDGQEFWPGLDLAIRKDNRIFAVKVLSAGTEDTILVAPPAGKLLEIKTSDVVAIGTENTNNAMKSKETGGISEQDQKNSNSNFDLQKDILDNADVVNALVNEAIANPAEAKAAFLENNKIC